MIINYLPTGQSWVEKDWGDNSNLQRHRWKDWWATWISISMNTHRSCQFGKRIWYCREMFKITWRADKLENIPSEAVKVYRERSLHLMFLDIAFAEIKICLVKERGCIMKYACFSSSMIKIRQTNPTNVWKRNVNMLCQHQHTSMKIWSDKITLHVIYLLKHPRTSNIVRNFCRRHGGREVLFLYKRTASVIICLRIYLGIYQLKLCIILRCLLQKLIHAIPIWASTLIPFIEIIVVISDFLQNLNPIARSLSIWAFFSLYCKNCETKCNLKLWWLSCTIWLFNHTFDLFKMKKYS